MIKSTTNCPTCGVECKIGGDGETHYYIPQPKLEVDSWDEVAKMLSNTKYRLPISKDDTAVYVVDIPKVIEYLKQQYTLIKK